MSSGEWREVKQDPVSGGNNYPSGGGRHSGTKTILHGISILSTVVTLFTLIARGCDDKPHMMEFARPQLLSTPQEPVVPYLAAGDVAELENYSPEDTAFIKRSLRIATMHIPSIEREQPDVAITKLLRQYSNLAQVRTLYMQVKLLGTELEALCDTLVLGAHAPLAANSQKDIRRLTRQVKEYKYDATKRAGGSLLMEPLLQKISADAKLFNSRLVKQLDRSHKVLMYLSECLQQESAPESSKLKSLTHEFTMVKIDAEVFDRHENRLRRHMGTLKPAILQEVQISNGRNQLLRY